MTTPFAFKRTGDADYPRFLKVLVMGPPKSGKTTFVSTAPNVLVAAVEAGLMSVAHLNMPYIDVDATDKLHTLLTVLRDDTLRSRAAKQLGLPKIETVAIDTLDAWQDLLKKEILKSNRRTEMQQADWGKLKEQMSVVLKAFCALPLNVIFTVHTTVTQDEESRQIYAPMLQGSIKDDVAGYVDFSLLSFRQKETDNDGTSHIRYYLKNEGDLKNPHLGNRSAGRVPEICEPNFKILHDLTFNGIDLAPTHIIPLDESPADAAPQGNQQEVAQSVSQPQTPVTPAGPKPTGKPADDLGAPINAAGITMLTREYGEMGLVVPGDLADWPLVKGRQVAKMFVSFKADLAAGKGGKPDLINYLQAVEAFHGEQTPIQTEKRSTKKKSAPDSEVSPTPAPADAEPIVAQDAQADAVSLLEQQVGAQVLGEQVSPDAKCEECGKTIDDVEIATLALGRFRKVLCLDDYKKLNQQQKAGTGS